MRLPRFRLRRFMIGIAVLAPVFAVANWLYRFATHLGTAMEDFYGLKGKLPTEAQISLALSRPRRAIGRHLNSMKSSGQDWRDMVGTRTIHRAKSWSGC